MRQCLSVCFRDVAHLGSGDWENGKWKVENGGCTAGLCVDATCTGFSPQSIVWVGFVDMWMRS